jgi:Zn-dependent protease with chaperone function
MRFHFEFSILHFSFSIPAQCGAALVALWLILGCVPSGRADDSPAPAAAHTVDPAGSDELRPVAVPSPTPLAVKYHRTGNWLWLALRAWSLLVPAALLFTGVSARLRTIAQRTGRIWFLTVGIYGLLYCALDFVIDLPVVYYIGYLRPHAYGLAAPTYTVGRWFELGLKELGLRMVGVFLFLWVPYVLIARSPKRWWLYLTMLSVPWAFFLALIAPIWIDTLFNDFGPMRNQALERKIEALAERAGVPGSRIYEIRKSVDTRALNAYVTGFLTTRRIVLYDTLLERLDEGEVLAVMGHEMGHYVLGHVTRSIWLASLLVLAGLFAGDRAGRWLTGRFAHRFGFESLADVASVPLLILLFQVALLTLAPLELAYSRYQEHQADCFALELTRSNHSAALAFAKLQHENLGVPWDGPLEKLWRASHPSIGERIEFCNAYHPWTEGRALRYGGLFRDEASTGRSSGQPSRSR